MSKNPDEFLEEHASKATHSPEYLDYRQMLAEPSTEWLIDGLLPKGGSVVLFGESNSFKSFLLDDMLCSIATGTDWHGHAVASAGSCLILASEGRRAIGNRRIPAWMAHHAIPRHRRGNIYLRKTPLLLDDEQDLAKLLFEMSTMEPVAAVGFDVLRGSMNGAEKDDEVIARWLAAREKVATEFGCTTIFVTHSPYSDSARMRGPTHLWGSFDTRLKAEGNKDKRTTVLSVDRHKDHDSTGKWGFRLDIVELDELALRGATSLVPVLDEGVADVKPAKLTVAARQALAALKYALAEGAGKHASEEHIPAGVLCLSAVLWRLYFDKKSTGETADARRKTFQRGLERLLDARLVAQWGDLFWLTPAGEAAP